MQEQWWRVVLTCHRHWRRVGSRAASRKPRETRGSEQLPPFFLSSPAVTNTVTCKSRKIHKTVGFNFFFPFLDLLLTFFPFF
jgi:hypothetical protein